VKLDDDISVVAGPGSRATADAGVTKPPAGAERLRAELERRHVAGGSRSAENGRKITTECCCTFPFSVSSI